MKKLSNRTYKIIVFAVSAILLALIVYQLIRYFTKPEKQVKSTLELYQKDLDIVFGNNDAELAIYMYSSYTCSFCRKFFTDTYPGLKQEYIDNGKVKIVMRLTSLTGDLDLKNSLKAMVCVNKYGNIEYLHQLLLENNKVVYTNEFQQMLNDFCDRDNNVAECMLGSDSEDYLISNFKEFEKFRFKGTPTFVVGKSVYTGYRNLKQFREIIDEHL